MSDPKHEASEREQMFQAAELNNLKLIERLDTEKKINVNIIDYNRRTPAHIAAMYGHLSVVKYLLEKDPSLIEVRDRSDETILMKAIIYGHLSVVKYLVENWKLSISTRYGHHHFGNTAIHLAAANGRLEILKYFIEERKGDVNIENDLRETPLFLAAENKLYRIIQYLVEEKGADAKKINSKGYNVLFKAIEIDDLGLMKYLIDMRKIPFDLNWRAFSGETLVHRAVELNRENVLLYLVSEKQCKVDIEDDLGETPLHKAASKNNYRVCRFLVEMGADIGAENEKRQIPVDLATNERLIRYMKDLLQANYETRNRRSAVFESPIIYPSMPAYSADGTSPERVSHTSNSHSPMVDELLPNSYSHYVHRADSFPFQSFLAIAKAIIRSNKSIIDQRLELNFLPTPREVILNRIDPAAIGAVWGGPNLQNLPSE